MKLADYLKKNKITQAEFANDMSVTQSAVAHWIAGRALMRDPLLFSRLEKLTGGQVTRRDMNPDLFKGMRE